MLLLVGAAQAQTQGVVYKCPGPPVLYTDALSAKEAADKGCKTIEGTPITIVQGQRPRPAAQPQAGSGAQGSASRPADGGRVDAQAQRSRDGERRTVLQNELRSAEAKLAELQRDYNGGNPERQGAERNNYQKYLDRVAELKAGITRQEADIEAIKREISKIP